MSPFSDEEVAGFQEVFGYYVTDKEKGLMAAEDLGIVMRNLGKCPLESELAEMLEKHGSSTMEFSDVLTYMETPLRESTVPNEKEILACFEVFDDEGTGKIEKNDFRKIMRDLGEGLSGKEFELIMAECDPDPDNSGYINYKKIIEVMFAKGKEDK